MRPLLIAVLFSALTSAALAKPAPPATTNQVGKLVLVLKSDASQKEKADACRELARIGNKEAVAPLAALLPDYYLSHMARYGLETIPDPSVDKALRAAAGRLHGRLLIGVIGSIGVRRDPKAVGLLARHLESLYPEVAQTAARALGKIGNQAAAKAIQAALPSTPEANRLAFCEGLIGCAERLAARGNRKEAIAIYDRLYGMAVPHQVRTAALRGAVLTRQNDGLPLLIEAIRGGDFALFAAATRVSQEMPGAQVTLALARELATPYTNRQILLIQTLGNRHDPAASPALLAAARDSLPPVRLAAIRALSEIGTPSALPVLSELVRSADKDVAAAAQESLAAMPGKETDAAVMAMLADSDPGPKLMAMDLIVRRRMTSAIPALLAAAENPEPKVRIAAIRKVGELGGAAELPAVLELMAKAPGAEDLEATEQSLIALGLKASDPADCIAKLETRMATVPPAQKCALVRVLAAVGGSNALQAIRSAVKDPNTEVHAAAIRALGGWNTADAAPDLLELAKSAANPTDKMICLRGYLRLASVAELPVDKRLAMCRQAAALAQKDDEKKLLLGALGGIASVEALDLITPYLDEAAIKAEAATAAVDVSDKLLKAKDAAKFAPRLAEVLNKVAGSTDNADLAKRAKDLRDQAKAKASAK
jgi:HEAT repeat protein